MSAHGTRWRYNEGCRCEECREASRRYDRRRAAEDRRMGRRRIPDRPCPFYGLLGRGSEPCTLPWLHDGHHEAKDGRSMMVVGRPEA